MVLTDKAVDNILPKQLCQLASDESKRAKKTKLEYIVQTHGAKLSMPPQLVH